MSALKSSPLLLLVVPLFIIFSSSPVASARRTQTIGCLKYGHSCLGAHGKRNSWHSDVQLQPPSVNQPSSPLSQPLLNILLDTLKVHPEVLASIRRSRDNKSAQPSEAFLQEIRYNSGRVVDSPNSQENEDIMGRAMPDTVLSMLGNRMTGRDGWMNDRLEDEGDALYVIDGEDYADDRTRRSTAEKMPAAKEIKKDLNTEIEWEKEDKKNRHQKENNTDLRLYAGWFRR